MVRFTAEPTFTVAPGAAIVVRIVPGATERSKVEGVGKLRPQLPASIAPQSLLIFCNPLSPESAIHTLSLPSLTTPEG